MESVSLGCDLCSVNISLNMTQEKNYKIKKDCLNLLIVLYRFTMQTEWHKS